jgi:hypothetical protein
MDRSVFSRSDPEARNKFLAADAGRVPVVLSATHGVEGLAGSGPQVDLLRHPPRLPPDTAVLLVHAVNPHGFAWLRRTSEAILQAELATARSVAIVDLHTGLGPYGYGEPKWGLTEFGYEHALAHAHIAFVALEFGTDPPPRGATTLRNDAWLWHHGDPRGPEAPS